MGTTYRDALHTDQSELTNEAIMVSISLDSDLPYVNGNQQQQQHIHMRCINEPGKMLACEEWLFLNKYFDW